jgi:hypothetical protein
LSTKDHSLTARGRSTADLARRKKGGDYVMMVDFVRQIGSDPQHTLMSLLSAVDPKMAQRPPHLRSNAPRRIARTLPLGVIGELHVRGAQVPAFRRLSQWNLGAVYHQG